MRARVACDDRAAHRRLSVAFQTSRTFRFLVTLCCFLLVLMVGFLDKVTGVELSFSIFYLVPILGGAWYAGRWPGVLLAVASAAVWVLAETAGRPYSQPWMPYWNGAVRLGLFLLLVLMLCNLRRLLDRERVLARTDQPTGVANRRAFYDATHRAIERSRETALPLTLLYIDLDGFKQINDRFGHAEGDRVLRSVADALNGATRASDIVARLGGDEFAVLLPETDQESSRAVIARIHQHLTELLKESYPLSVSVGAVTFRRPPPGVEDMVRKADALMYQAKREGGGGVQQEVIA